MQVAAIDKLQWNDGLLAIFGDKSGSHGASRLLKTYPALDASLAHSLANPATELTSVVESGKSTKAACFLSLKQVKYYNNADSLRVLGSRIVRTAKKLKLSKIAIPFEGASTDDLRFLVQGLSTAAYEYCKYKSKPDKSAAITINIGVASTDLKAAQAVLREEKLYTASITFARDVVNEIPAEMYPEKLAAAIKKAAAGTSLKLTVYDKKRLQRENFNGVLTVGKGSIHAPVLMVLKHSPAKKSRVHLCLVGKAVTFDTGGHSLKQPKGMWEMKGDMAGGAAVLGAMQVIAQLNPAIEVTGIVPSVVNAIGPEAVLPGDIIRSRSGKTVHVDNTDAEGRLILMDALDLAREIGATHIVDVATLTGSIVRALGESVAGLFANDDDWATHIKQVGDQQGEGFWHMPLIPEYREGLDHPVADIDNVGKSINAGAITAALFLQEFVPEQAKWAHLDIAGVGLYTRQLKHFSPGATGFGVRTLAALATNLATNK